MATTRPCEASPAGTTTGTGNLNTRVLRPVLPSRCYVSPEIAAAARWHGVGDVVYQRAGGAHSRASACARDRHGCERRDSAACPRRDAAAGVIAQGDAGDRVIARGD